MSVHLGGQMQQWELIEELTSHCLNLLLTILFKWEEGNIWSYVCLPMFWENIDMEHMEHMDAIMAMQETTSWCHNNIWVFREIQISVILQVPINVCSPVAHWLWCTWAVYMKCAEQVISESMLPQKNFAIYTCSETASRWWLVILPLLILQDIRFLLQRVCCETLSMFYSWTKCTLFPDRQDSNAEVPI